MPVKPLPPRALVRELLSYDDESGVFTWLARSGETWWNSRYAGKIAGSVKSDGHIEVSIGHSLYKAHRLAWLYMRGEPVPDLIDHEDRDKANNRWGNLREATKSQNGANMRLRSSNTTGIKGTGVLKGRHRARIMLDGKEHHLGYFDTLEEAAVARREAAERLHGEFARHG